MRQSAGPTTPIWNGRGSCDIQPEAEVHVVPGVGLDLGRLGNLPARDALDRSHGFFQRVKVLAQVTPRPVLIGPGATCRRQRRVSGWYDKRMAAPRR